MLKIWIQYIADLVTGNYHLEGTDFPVTMLIRQCKFCPLSGNPLLVLSLVAGGCAFCQPEATLLAEALTYYNILNYCMNCIQ